MGRRASAKLPPPQQNRSDQIIWADDLYGRFIVKSVTGKEQIRIYPFHMQQDKILWSKIWQLDMQDRLKLIL